MYKDSLRVYLIVILEDHVLELQCHWSGTARLQRNPDVTLTTQHAMS